MSFKEKDETYWKILSGALELDFKKGHLKWTLSDLSRKCKITRSLIYYYFGKSKENILEEAVKLIGEEMAGLSSEREKMWKDGKFEESMLLARSILDRAPFIGPFMLEHRQKPTPLGKSLIEIEERFLDKIRQFFPDVSEDRVLGIFCTYWGMCFCPRLTEESIRLLVSNLRA